MTDLEVLQRAKLYMDRLAQGIDPISEQELPEDSTLNQVRLARCFFYVSGVLQRVIDNGGQVGSKPKKNNFAVTERMLRLTPSEQPLRITEFAELLAGAVDEPNAKRPSTTTMTNWLLSKGLLEKAVSSEGKQQRVPTENGRRIGIYTEMRQGQYGEYAAVYYGREAQQFLLDHLEEIFAEKQTQPG